MEYLGQDYIKQIKNEDLTSCILISVGLKPIKHPDLSYLNESLFRNHGPYKITYSDDPGELFEHIYAGAKDNGDIEIAKKIQNATHSAFNLCVQNYDLFAKQEYFKRGFDQLIILLDLCEVTDSRSDLKKFLDSRKLPNKD